MRRLVALLLLLIFCSGAALAVTTGEQKKDFWQEFDITFWQTLPFASFWGYVIGTQMAGGGAVNWNLIFPVVTGVSLLNANLHAKKTVDAHSRLSR